MDELIKSALEAMSSTIKKPHKKFLTILLNVLAVFQGRATFRNLSRYSNLGERTWSRWFRRHFDFMDFNTQLLQQHLPEHGTRIAALDASFVKKSGRHTQGLGWFYSGAAGKSLKGLEISTIAVVDMLTNTGYALDTRQTIDADVAGTEESRVTAYGKQVVSAVPSLKALGITYLVVDSFYSKEKFIGTVRDAGLHVAGKLRKDANLRYFHKTGHSGRGRPRKYAGKVNLAGSLPEWKRESCDDEKTEAYSHVVWSAGMKRKLKVVILRRIERGAIGQAILFTTDTKLDACSVIAYYRARFQIEFVFRDAKQHTGLMDCQARCREAIHTHVNASMTSLNLLKLEDQKHQGVEGMPRVISIASWKRRKFNQNLMQVIFKRLGLEQTLTKVSEVYESLTDYGAIAA